MAGTSPAMTREKRFRKPESTRAGMWASGRRSHARMADEGHVGRHVARGHVAIGLLLAQDAVAHHRSGRSDDAPALGRTAPLRIVISPRLDPAYRHPAERRLDQFGETNEF